MLTLGLGSTIFSNPQVSYADTIPTPGIVEKTSSDRPTQINPQGSDINRILDALWNNVTRVIFGLISAYAVVTLTLASLKYGTARGDTKKTAEARAAIVQIVLGIALLVASTVVVSLIWSFIRLLSTG
jgi:fatty acid desaturase